MRNFSIKLHHGQKTFFLFFLLTFFFGCKISNQPLYLFPSEKQMEVKYLCNLPYFENPSSNQKWNKSKPAWLILNGEKTIVFFENNQTFLINENIDVKLPPGKYRCIY